MVTASTMLGVFGVIKATSDGWGSAVTLGSMAGAAVLFGLFLLYEGRISNPIMPLHILRNRGLIGSSVVRGLLVTGMFSVFFLGALYLGQGSGLRRDAAPASRSCPRRCSSPGCRSASPRA